MADTPDKGWSAKNQERAKAEGWPSWEGWIAVLEERRGFKICGAYARSWGGPCRQSAGHGMGPDQDWGRCSIHGQKGGNAVAGPQHPRWKDGRDSKHLLRFRGAMAENYAAVEEAIEDLFDLAMEARVLTARMVTLLNDTPDTPVTPRVLGDVVDRLDRSVGELMGATQEVLDGGDPRRMMVAIRDLQDTLSDVRDGELSDAKLQAAAWGEWHRLVNQKRLLARTHSIQEARKAGPVTYADVAMIVDQVKVAVLRFVPDDSKPDFLQFFRRLHEAPAATDFH